MHHNTTSAAVRKSPVPSSITEPGPSAFSQCDDASCNLERLIILLDTITDLQRCACEEMPPSETRDRALFEVFCLLLLLHDNLKLHSEALGHIQVSIAIEAKLA